MPQPLVLELDDARWLEFVRSRPEATPFHHPAWARLLGDCYGFRAFAVGLAEDDALVAGAPVVEARGPTGRKRWISLPFTDYVPPLGPADRIALLVSNLDEERRSAGARSLELHADAPGGTPVTRGWSHVLRLQPNPEDVLRALHPSHRTSVRKAARQGVVVRAGRDESDLLETFYGLHLATRRRQGVPIQPHRFFVLLWERILSEGLGALLIAELEGRAVAAAVFLQWNRTLVYKFGASDAAHLEARPNHAIFSEAIRNACVAGLDELDFGRTDSGNEGLRTFKARWGADERPLVYTALDGDHSAASTGRGAAILSTVIRHSPPWVCKAAGERLYRYAA
jgi:CelD/BcsL family acetyltransferase involved in cellulose biosynthesis